MRRRETPGALPDRLRVFHRSDWPGRDDAERYGAFVDARGEWKSANGIVALPDDDAIWAAFPDGPFRPEEV